MVCPSKSCPCRDTMSLKHGSKAVPKQCCSNTECWCYEQDEGPLKIFWEAPSVTDRIILLPQNKDWGCTPWSCPVLGQGNSSSEPGRVAPWRAVCTTALLLLTVKESFWSGPFFWIQLYIFFFFFLWLQGKTAREKVLLCLTEHCPGLNTPPPSKAEGIILKTWLSEYSGRP